MRKLRVLSCELGMAALVVLLAASASAATLARQSGAFGIVTCDSIPVSPVTPAGILARQCGAFGIVTYDVDEGAIVDPDRIHIPGEGTVVVPKSWKVGQKVTWKATAAKGSVFARWEGAFVDLLSLTKNERRNPSLAFVVPVGFETNGISAVFISVDDDRLGTLALSQPGPLAPNADVAGLSLVDDSESYVTASVSGLPTGLKFDAKTLAITGKPTKPGVYTVKVTAKNASGYQWAENIALRVADIADARIDFGGLPETGAVGEPFAGRIAAGDATKLSASGWPSGVKFNAKTGAVAGIPTKGGWFTVTVTATYADKSKATATRLLTISPAVTAEPKRTAYLPLTVVSANAAGGTATGTSVYAEGKKVSISAKPAKGYVFAGWYRDPDLTEPMAFAANDWRKASQSVVVPEVRYLFARFVTERDDGNNIALAVDGVEMAAGAGHLPYQTNVMCGVYMEWPVAVETLSLPKVAVAGLPVGLKFTEKPVTSKIGSGKTAVVVTNVPAYTIYGAPTAASKVDTKTGAVKPSVVKVTVTTASKAKVVYEIDVTVDAMNEWAVGTFDGVSGDGRDGARPSQDDADAQERVPPEGLVTLTVAANGKISGKVIDADGTWTLSAASFDSYDAESETYVATVIGKNGKKAITNEVMVSAEEVRLGEDASPHRRGVVSGATVGRAVPGEPYSWAAWQNLWKTEPWKTDAKPFAKAPALAIDAGARDACPYPGTITLKFAASGAVAASGKFVTGQDAKGRDIVYSASCSSVLVPEADAAGAGRPPYRIFLYFPPKAGKFEGYADEVSLVWNGTGFSVELGGVQLWEGGPYWAECNVGASKPEEYGYYFWWGDTVGYTRSGGRWLSGGTSYYYSGVTWVSSTGQQMSSSPFSSSSCPTYCKDNSALQLAGYIDSTGNLVAAHDAATAHLGAQWRMPTDAEISALINNCTTTWITTNGVPGRLVTGKGAYADRSIFLPAAGGGDNSFLNSPGSCGYYWSSTPHSGDSDDAWNLYFDSIDFSRYDNRRFSGRSVRPVRGFAE